MAERYPAKLPNIFAEDSEDDDQGIYNVSRRDETPCSIPETHGKGNGGTFGEFTVPPDNNINSSLVPPVLPYDALPCSYAVKRLLEELKDVTGNHPTDKIRKPALRIINNLYQILSTEPRYSSMNCDHLTYLHIISNLVERTCLDELSSKEVEDGIKYLTQKFNPDHGNTAGAADPQQQENPPSTPATLTAPQSEEQVAVVVVEIAREPSFEDYRAVLNSSHSGRTKSGTIPLYMVPKEACITSDEWRRVQKAKRARHWRQKHGNELRELRQDRDRSHERRGDGDESNLPYNIE